MSLTNQRTRQPIGLARRPARSGPGREMFFTHLYSDGFGVHHAERRLPFDERCP
ncbi:MULTISPECIES: hypothetical protein [Burkholderia]|jgi:hypothetical protein|uniref:Uncharacterized protein n=1 Tax=Burkholderia contaminans TaxID=488447 RepID=A0ABD7YBZ3_9BURK|nr:MULTISPECIES: hypothetical protein [Burkholderia]UTP26796.1 hypothetical protein NMB33_37665 [Burkholderia sp. FXe9]MBK1911074.1 hypothetical protein [Burkholderia contaminans]MBK1949045.1 hypothetical protein [Burkholderia contaminans]MBK1957151.1 hypothetical protein [Burkholderia contaminans]MBO1833347.1 hypothetical protein [Burkholderia contaminans]